MYQSNEDTLKEWAKQLNIVSKGNYPLYPTVGRTLSHWKDILNQNEGVNGFDLGKSDEATIYSWKDKLNCIYNK